MNNSQKFIFRFWVIFCIIVMVVFLAIALSGCNRHTEIIVIAHTVNIDVDAEAKLEVKADIP